MIGEKLYYKKGYKYQTTRDWRIQTSIFPKEDITTDWIELHKDGLLFIRKGYAWDGASGPTIDTKSSMRGSLGHDALYELMRLGLLKESWRHEADKLLHDLCTDDGMLSIRADTWREMVELFAAGCARAGSEQSESVAPEDISGENAVINVSNLGSEV